MAEKCSFKNELWFFGATDPECVTCDDQTPVDTSNSTYHQETWENCPCHLWWCRVIEAIVF